MTRWSTAAILFLCALNAAAHLNSPHVFVEENAGPYPVIAIIRMPSAVPGSAEVQVMLKDRNVGDAVEVWVREIPPEGEKQAPAWSRATETDPNFFSKPLPLMVLGVWRAQIRVKGNRGEGTIEIPVSARVATPKAMNMGLAAMLVGLLGLLYTSGYQLLVGLGRDAQRSAAEEISPRATRMGRIYAATALVVLSGYIGVLAYAWYLFHVNTRSGSVPPLTSKLISYGSTMELRIEDSDGRPLVDVQPDHGKMMHMVVVDVPVATRFFHLHPRKIGLGRFEFNAPALPGRYKLFADIVRSSGEGDTVTANLDVSTSAAGSNRVVNDPDDSSSTQASLGALPVNQDVYDLDDGLKMRWIQHPVSLRAGEFHKLTFELSAADGKPLPLEPYMGMDGHLLIMRADMNVFAHVHPMGTLPARMTMMGGMMNAHASHSRVSFPYGFPEKGVYRLWTQVKYQGRVRTGVFDVAVK